MKLVALRVGSDQTLYLNPQHVIAVKDHGRDACYVWTIATGGGENDPYFQIDEPVEDVVSRLQAAD